MKIVTVIPILKGTIKESLTYFSKENLEKGDVISIPIRNKIAYGLITEIKDAEESKLNIKSLPYVIKKIGQNKPKKIFSEEIINSAETISQYYVSSLGNVLSSIIPKVILENSHLLPEYTPKKQDNIFYETLLLQSDEEERYASYKSLIREEFARGKSVFFCLPTTEDIKNAGHNLEKGIEKYTYTIHSLLPKKTILENWQKIVSENHPVLIIGTGSFLSIPREDISTIILEKESSRAYKMQSRPFADWRKIAEIIAKNTKRKLVLGDFFLRTETLWEEKNSNYSELSPIKFRSLGAAECKIIDSRTPKNMEKEEFSVFSDELKSLIISSFEKSEKTFLFTGRKGLYPLTICGDCGTEVICNNCNAPVVLYGKRKNQTPSKRNSDENLFVCHHCGERRSANELCHHCKSWRLIPLGIGVERVYEEIQKIKKDANIFIFDKDHIKTHNQAVKIRDQFYKFSGSIMVGTEMALTYLNEKIQNSAVVSIDSLFSIPDFRISEKIFHIILEMRSITEKKLLVQTRQEENSSGRKIFEYALKGNLMDFYRDEIKEREIMKYPPFSIFIKLSVEGEKSSVRKQMEEMGEIFKNEGIIIFEAFNPGKNKKFTMHGLIPMERKKWVDKELLFKLKNLPPQISVKVDPDSLL